MPMNSKRNKFYAALVTMISLLLIVASLTIGRWGPWLAADRQGPFPPATINNDLATIKSNILRIQVIMENLVFSKYPAELANHVADIDQLEAAISNDFNEMSSGLSKDNAQYQKALDLFRQWKSIRDEAISLTEAGPSPTAKALVLGKCADHARKIQAALVKLGAFSRKRSDDFDSAASAAAREKGANK